MVCQNDILVSICCITYNHAPYIRQCLDGFLMQETNFKYEIIIHDDCSTDGTTDIIKEYAEKHPDLIVPIFQQTNQFQNGNKRILATFVYPKARGKYIALCEGDDYWIDPEKLQKQVDIMQKDDTIGMVYTKAQKYIQDESKFGLFFGDKVACFDDELIDNKIPTLTVCFRLYLYNQYQDSMGKRTSNLSLGDYPIWLYIMTQSKVFFIDEVSGIYRVLSESASHSSNTERMIKYYEDINYIKNIYINQYPQLLNDKRRVLSTINDSYAWSKYRLKVRDGYATLTKQEYDRLSLMHKMIYLCNYCVRWFNIQI